MVRMHYSHGRDRRLQELDQAGRILDVSRHSLVEELCLAADSLLTDYSSIMFDYAVLDRPVVIHAPDWDVYRTMRGTYFDLLSEPPGVVTTTDGELVDAFRSGAVQSEEAAGRRAVFRSRFCSLEDGRAAERVVQKVWLSEEGLARATPDPDRGRARIGA
jgi:CDP-glycerol glycerophosphotransferase